METNRTAVSLFMLQIIAWHGWRNQRCHSLRIDPVVSDRNHELYEAPKPAVAADATACLRLSCRCSAPGVLVERALGVFRHSL
jgi:hypothetical protein